MSHTLELGLVTLLFGAFTVQAPPDRQRLLTPSDPAFTERAADRSMVTLETTKGTIVVEVIRAWAPRGADRFTNLVRHGYYDEAMVFRIRPKTWAQFGIAGDPKVAQAWRHATFPDDPFRESNVRGTVAFAFAVPHGRTTQVFINLRDNAATHDTEPFVPFGRVIQGLEVADAWNAEYGEGLGGIRAGKQDAGFAEGNAFFRREFPRLDMISRAVVAPSRLEQPRAGTARAR
jgi:cyclophilin family peptidyl-prolyl cis-trans isomerase